MPNSLEMSFDPNVIDDLGAKLYSTLPPVIAELIANGYDACATRVDVKLYDEGDAKAIVIKDNGHGMSFEEINSKYLVIGRKKRQNEAEDPSHECARPPIGKKGLGKLSFFGIAKTGMIETVQDGKKVTFTMDLEKIHAADGVYRPEFKLENTTEATGTTITLTGIYRKTDFDLEAIRRSIANYFIFDDDFEVYTQKNDSAEPSVIDNSARYLGMTGKEEYTWEFPDTGLIPDVKQFPFSSSIRGKIILFDKPVKSNLRGVTLFARKKLVNLPEFFPIQGSSYFYQYMTGWLEIDFIDEIIPDVISTNRSSLAWNDDSLADLSEFLKEVVAYIHREWRRLQREKAKSRVKERLNIDPDAWRDSNSNNSVITENIDKLLSLLSEPEQIPQEEIVKIFDIVHSLAPEHADFVLWSGLHGKITSNDFIREKFFEGNYLEAAREAAQIYNEEVQLVSRYGEDGYLLMEKSYGKEPHKKIWVTAKVTENDKNIEEGQKLLSQGIMTGFKNPAVSHSSVTRGRLAGEFTDRHCLDILSTISYLYNRLERRTQP